MSGLVKGWIPDVKLRRPATKREAVEHLNLVFDDEGNQWSKGEQNYFVNVMLGLEGNWHTFDVPKLKIMLKDLERSGMILYER